MRLYLELGAAFVLVLAFVLYTLHERQVGQNILQHSLDAQSVQLHREAALETKRLQDEADKAHEVANANQTKLDAYIASLPLGSVVCNVTRYGDTRVRQGGPLIGTTANQIPEPAGLPNVPERIVTSDISRGLSAIVRAAGSVSISLGEYQR